MRLALDPRASRLLRRLARTNVYTIAELTLLALIAIQAARLVWAIVTPVGPLGDWRIERPAVLSPAGRQALFSGFDPFFRLENAGSGAAVVTSLQLQLFGVRVNEATGQGSAIIAGPDGVQSSYAVGDEIMPGVTLKAVGHDSVTILRGSAPEQLFLDQSVDAPLAAAAGGPAGPATNTMLGNAAGARPVTPAQIRSDVQFIPRMEAGRVTGYVVRPQGSGEAFRAAGLREGDIIVAVNGDPVAAAGDVIQAALALPGGGTLSVSVERGGEPVPLSIAVTTR